MTLHYIHAYVWMHAYTMVYDEKMNKLDAKLHIIGFKV
jgi:hypothetical protein